MFPQPVGGTGGGGAVSLGFVKPALVIAGLACGLAGCAPSLAPVLSPSGAVASGSRVGSPRIAWIQPENRNRLHKPGDLQELDDAPLALREALRAASEARGCASAPPVRLDSLVQGLFPSRNLTDGQAARLGAEFGADLAVYGTLEAWKRGTLFGRSTTVRFRLTVVDREGTPLAEIRHGGTAAQEDPSDLAAGLAAEVVERLLPVWGGCREPGTAPR